MFLNDHLSKHMMLEWQRRSGKSATMIGTSPPDATLTLYASSLTLGPINSSIRKWQFTLLESRKVCRTEAEAKN